MKYTFDRAPILARPTGLGDAIMLAGAAVELVKRHGGLRFPCLPNHCPSLNVIFGSVPEIEIVPVRDHTDILSQPGPHILIGWFRKEELEWHRMGLDKKVTKPVDCWLYDELEIPVDARFESFPWKFTPSGNPRSTPYIYLHDDASRGLVINRYVNWSQDQMCCPGTDRPITEWADSIYYASEIHVINSSSMHMAELLPLIPEQPKYIHRYARATLPHCYPTLKHNWTFID